MIPIRPNSPVEGTRRRCRSIVCAFRRRSEVLGNGIVWARGGVPRRAAYRYCRMRYQMPVVLPRYRRVLSGFPSEYGKPSYGCYMLDIIH